MKKEQTKTLQIMVIDHNKYIRESLGTFFADKKLKLLIFKSAAEGLNSLKYQDIDIVISDYFLPDMDGLTFLKHAAVQKPGITRVLMATIVNDELKNDISMAGIDGLLEKPLNVASIDHIICKFNKKFSTPTKPETRNER